MKRVLAILILLPLLLSRTFASIITNDNTVLVFFGTSYDVAPDCFFGDHLGSWVALGHPQFTNHWSSASRSGGSLQEANELRLERLGLAHWAYGSRAIGLIMADDNGGYTSNQVVFHLTNTLSAPSNLFNGFAYTNEGGWCSTQSVTWIGIGAIPHDSSDGDSGEIARNNAVTNMFSLLGRPYVDMWNPLWTGGWSNDNNGAHLLGYFSGSHPYDAGSVTMGIIIAQNLAGSDTNVSLATIDFNTAAVVSTNHCVISSISENGNTLTFTRHDDRLPMAWDVPDGTVTNDCRNGFVAMPQLSNAFWFSIAVTNLPAGNYKVSIDGAQIITLSSAQLASGWNMFTDWNSNSPYWKQRVAVLAHVRLKNGVDPVTLLFTHTAGEFGPNGADLINYESYAHAYWDLGNRGDALIAAMAPLSESLNGYDKLIHDTAQPTNHVFTIAPAGQAQTIIFPTPGDQTYGVAPIPLGATASSGLTVTYTITSGPATVSGNVLTITNAGAVTIQASQAGDATWLAATPVSQTISVSQKTLTPSITASNKIYDGTSTARIATRSVSGVVGADVVLLSGGVATFPDKTIGTARIVTATGLSLTGADAGKYVLSASNATTTADLTPLGLIVIGVTAIDKPYDGITTATVNTNGAVLVGVIGADAVNLSGTAIGLFADGSVAAGKTVTISGLNLSGADAGNYSLTQPTAIASITKATTANTVTSSLSPSPPGSNVTFTATLSVVPPGSGTPTGNIIFRDGTTLLGTNTLNGLAPSIFAASSLSHGGHTISAEYRGDANFFGSTNTLSQVIDLRPVASDALLERYATSGVKIRSSALLTNDIDADGDVLRLISVSATNSNGATITTNGDWICYVPPPDFTNSDCFLRVIADGFGLQSTGLVSVVVRADTNTAQNFAVLEGILPKFSPLTFLGIPHRVYTIQYTTNLASPDWQTLGTATAGSRGFIQFFDDPPANSPPRIYRTTYP